MLQSNQLMTESNFTTAETRRNVWCATVPYGVKKSDIFQPEFFANIAQRLTVNDRIECNDEAGTYFLELIVVAVAERIGNKAPNWANVVELRYCDLVRPEDKALKLPEGFYAKWRGGAKWSVLRRGAAEGEDVVIVERQQTRADAIREFEKMKSKLVA